MKLNKTMGRVATTLVATAMLASVAVVPAFADGAVTSVNIGKTVTTDGHSFAPVATYAFSVTNGDAGKYSYKEDGSQATEQTVMAGIDGLTVSTTSSEPSGDTPSASYTLADATISIDAATFQNATPGIYHYVVSEQPGTVQGMTYDSSKYDLYVYVLNGPTGNNDHYVAAVAAVKQVYNEEKKQLEPGTDKAEKIAFVNDYDTNNSQLHDVTITKLVQGNMGDKMKDTFNFDVSVIGDDGEVFYIEYKTTGSESTQTTKVKSGESVEIQGLKDTGVITIYGLDSTDSYTVTENSKGSGTGYTVYVEDAYTTGGKYTDAGVEQTNTYNSTMGNTDQNIAFYNVKEGNVATGIVMNVAPYALLVVVAAAGCFVFMRKRRED